MSRPRAPFTHELPLDLEGPCQHYPCSFSGHEGGREGRERGPYLQRAEKLVEVNDTLDDLLRKEARETALRTESPNPPPRGRHEPTPNPQQGAASERSISGLKAPERVSRYGWPRDPKRGQANGTTGQRCRRPSACRQPHARLSRAAPHGAVLSAPSPPRNCRGSKTTAATEQHAALTVQASACGCWGGASNVLREKKDTKLQGVQL